MKTLRLNIIYFLESNWETDYKRPHLEALGKYTNLLCLERPVTLDFAFRYPAQLIDWMKRRRFLRQISPTIWLCKPITLVPYLLSMRFAWFKKVNCYIMKASLKRALKQLGMTNIVVMLTNPAQGYVIDMLGETVLCYDIYDEHSEHWGASSRMRQLFRSVETEILKQADIAFTSARNLMMRKKSINPNTHFVPNAADVVFFLKTLDPETVVPPDLEQIPEPRIGLIGHLMDIVDMDLLVFLAEQKSDWSIVLIGKNNASSRFLNSTIFKKAKELPNLHIMGFRDYLTLPSYQKGLSVCLLPYLINEYTVNVYPNKVHQYLAGGKPVVSTNLPEMRPFADVVDVANSHREFLALVEIALQSNSKERITKRIEIAKENTVEKRAEMKVRLLEETLFGDKCIAASQ